jgi:D-2-hydroxyacid dehydrogenase (NADP+)
MALMLALARRLPEARDNQAKRVWRGMIGDLTLGGKTLLIVGLGQIGRPARAARQGVRHARDRHPRVRHPRAGAGRADAVHAMSELNAVLPKADFVALTCPLTAETEKLIDALSSTTSHSFEAPGSRGGGKPRGICRAPEWLHGRFAGRRRGCHS